MELGEEYCDYAAAIDQFEETSRYVALAYQKLDNYDLALQKKHEETCAVMKELTIASEAKVDADEKARAKADSRPHEKEATLDLQATHERLNHANLENGGLRRRRRQEEENEEEEVQG